jgi:hypothetical protein
MARYRAGMLQRDRELRDQTRARAARAMEAARAAAALLRERYGATRVVLYGSLARGEGHFTRWSDVDIAAWGIPDRDWVSAPLDALTVSKEIEVNLVLAQDAPAFILDAIAREGRDL